ncbi:Swi3-domain-containing protein [Sporormia fimetaria CBS 119925]|uniref:Chromosome segregation in meiosis protein n=1 Tax=Sporormia fimetaria CBS 119925 TaxID=1340428 RepID=A0A6A6VES5_9PLEO|nr:Swi3-domain-containing protein [Sporormia fimetaria CBS 119925]
MPCSQRSVVHGLKQTTMRTWESTKRSRSPRSVSPYRSWMKRGVYRGESGTLAATLMTIIRLLSSAGIPKLQKITKERLRYKGKGHEYGDITRMLNIYQLWLDDLYPRAKFADALAIIEAQGHKRRMQVSRMAWIKESKPRIGPDSDEEPEEPISVQLPAGGAPASGEPIQDIQTVERDTSSTGQEGPPREAIQREAAPASTFNNDGPDEDELDALLAESDALHSMSAPLPQPPATEDDPFADEMEAMAEMEGMW